MCSKGFRLSIDARMVKEGRSHKRLCYAYSSTRSEPLLCPWDPVFLATDVFFEYKHTATAPSIHRTQGLQGYTWTLDPTLIHITVAVGSVAIFGLGSMVIKQLKGQYQLGCKVFGSRAANTLSRHPS
jgi:hypothetical protein